MSLLRAFGGYLTAFALLSCLVAPAVAQEEDPGPPFVDLKRVLEEYRKTTAFADFQVKIRNQAKVYAEEMKALAQLRYCTPAEREEAMALKAKGQPTAKELARIAELLKKADAVDNEMVQLSQKPKPSDADTKRVKDISRLRVEAAQMLAKEEANRQLRLRQMESDLMTEVEAELLKMVQGMAKEYKLPVIYERRALLTGGSDLTILVLKRLPK